MVYATGWSWDVFVSYWGVDDQRMQVAKTGWVTALVHDLKTLLAQAVGRRDRIAVYFDTRLRGYAPLESQLLGAVRSSACMLVILSPGYLKSKWCRKELAAYVEAGRGDRRVFIVELDDLAQKKRPEPLRDLAGYRFWYVADSGTVRRLGNPPPTRDPRYLAELDRLASELAEALHEVVVSTRQSSPSPRRRIARPSPQHVRTSTVPPIPSNVLQLATAVTNPIASGYLINSGLAITAARPDERTGDVLCRTAGGNWQQASTVVQHGDIAVLQANVQNGVAPTPWARWNRRDPLRCEFIGFCKLPTTTAADTYRGSGTLVPGMFEDARKIALRVDPALARDVDGLDGAQHLLGTAVFAKGHLIGVISAIPALDATVVIEPLDNLARNLRKLKRRRASKSSVPKSNRSAKIGNLFDLKRVPNLEHVAIVNANCERLQRYLDDNMAPGVTLISNDYGGA